MVEPGNVWGDNWDVEAEEPWFTGAERTLPGAERLKASVYQLKPGGKTAYHFHHGNEELVIVLKGRPTLRTPAGSRQLAEGDVVPFRRGPEGAHGFSNETSEPIRYVVMSVRETPDAVEYPDTRQVSVMALTNSQLGEPLWAMLTVDEAP